MTLMVNLTSSKKPFLRLAHTRSNTGAREWAKKGREKNMASSKKTKKRTFACGHKGYGILCHRCAQANDLETKANELAQAIKAQAKTLPAFVVVQKAAKATETAPELESGILIKGGGQRIFIGTNNKDQETALTQAVATMREHATRLEARPENKVRVFS